MEKQETSNNSETITIKQKTVTQITSFEEDSDDFGDQAILSPPNALAPQKSEVVSLNSGKKGLQTYKFAAKHLGSINMSVTFFDAEDHVNFPLISI